MNNKWVVAYLNAGNYDHEWTEFSSWEGAMNFANERLEKQRVLNVDADIHVFPPKSSRTIEKIDLPRRIIGEVSESYGRELTELEKDLIYHALQIRDEEE
jgi:hypothetical protein